MTSVSYGIDMFYFFYAEYCSSECFLYCAPSSGEIRN